MPTRRYRVGIIGRVKRQQSLFYAALGPQSSLLKDDLLDPIDALLDDEELVGAVRDALARRRPNSAKTGRYGIAPDRLARLCVLKHLKGWSFRELEREVRGSLVYRQFCRIDHDEVPDSSTLCRSIAALGPEVVEAINARLVAVALSEGIVSGKKLRVDTTVVETNVHYPTDSTLLADAVRVVVRSLQQLGAQAKSPKTSVKRRLLEINRAASCRNEAGHQRMLKAYRRLLRIASRTRKAGYRGLRKRARTARQRGARGALKRVLPLLDRVIAQTRARLFKGNTRFPNKVLSIFEEHTQMLCRGKAHKPTEFGRLVRVDEVENGVITNFSVKAGSNADQPEWMPAMEAHVDSFGRPPRLAVGDRGFFSGANERNSEQLGIKRVVLPSTGRPGEQRSARQKQRWFQRGLRWRAGIEGRIGTLKHRFGLSRATYKGDRGFRRYVAWGIATNNVVAIARVQCRRARSASHSPR